MHFIGKNLAFFSRRPICVFPGLGSYSGTLTALVRQMIGEYPSRPFKNISGQTMVTVRWMRFMSIPEKLCQKSPVFFIAVLRPSPTTPLVIAGSVDAHDPAKKIHRILYSELFNDLIIFPLPITYSLPAPTPSTQYPFFNLAISTSCFATIKRSRSTSLNDLLLCRAAYGFPLCGSSASSPSSKYFLTHAQTSEFPIPVSLSI